MRFSDLDANMIQQLGNNYLSHWPQPTGFSFFNSHNNQEIASKLADFKDTGSVKMNWQALIDIYRGFKDRDSILAKGVERLFQAVCYDIEFFDLIPSGRVLVRSEWSVNRVADTIVHYLQTDCKYHHARRVSMHANLETDNDMHDIEADVKQPRTAIGLHNCL